jgi:hypothetical protein
MKVFTFFPCDWARPPPCMRAQGQHFLSSGSPLRAHVMLQVGVNGGPSCRSGGLRLLAVRGLRRGLTPVGSLPLRLLLRVPARRLLAISGGRGGARPRRLLVGLRLLRVAPRGCGVASRRGAAGLLVGLLLLVRHRAVAMSRGPSGT